MRTKFLGIALSAVLASSAFAGVASAHHQPDHSANEHGMCTAYFSGSENGQGNKRDNGTAFGNFEDYVGDRDDDDDVDAYDVADYCDVVTGGFGNPGQGNDPYFGDSDCGFEDDPSTPDTDESERCQELEDQEGGSTPGESNGNNNPPGRS